MPRFKTIFCALALVAALALGGCGTSGEKFTSTEADRALAALDSIQDLVDEGRCKTAQRRVDVLVLQAAKVNSDRQDLGAAYAESAKRLQQLVARECVEIKESPTGETGETGQTGPTETPEPTHTPTPTPEPTNGGTPPQQPNNPPNNGNGNGNGNGNNGGGNNGGGDNGSGGVRPQ
ncbi:MAG: hypothetical protein ACRDKI_06000 [Solirubrobacterales bacterium]